MRIIILFCCLMLIVSCKSKKTASTTKPVEKNIILVKPSEVDVIKINRAEDLGTRLLETCNISRFRGFSSTEATDKVRQNATKEKISSICQKINQRNGRFLGINLIDIKRDKVKNEYTFRYAINYEKKLYKRELFVTINAENKVSAISTKEVPAKPM